MKKSELVSDVCIYADWLAVYREWPLNFGDSLQIGQHIGVQANAVLQVINVFGKLLGMLWVLKKKQQVNKLPKAITSLKINNQKADS